MAFDHDKIESLYPEAGHLMIEPMLIWKTDNKEALSKVFDGKEYFLQEKIDGYFEQIVITKNHVYMFSRVKSSSTGLLTEKISHVPHIERAFKDFPENSIIIGEIYIPNGTSKNVTSILGCLPAKAITRQEKEGLLNLYIHDIIYYDNINLMMAGAEDRYNILKAVFYKHNLDDYSFLQLAGKIDKNLELTVSNILISGGEGAVLKKRDAPYVPGKRPAWSTIKIKQMDSIDLVCTGFCPPTREYTGKELDTWDLWLDPVTEEKHITDAPETNWIPITRYYFNGWYTAIEVGAYDSEGNLKTLGKVSSGLTDEIKQDMTENPDKYLNRVCSLDCMSIDKKEHTLRHPAFKNWRDDKSAKDCIISETFS